MNGALTIIVVLVIGISIYFLVYALNRMSKKSFDVKQVNCESCQSIQCTIRNKDGFKNPEQCEIHYEAKT